MKRHSGNICSAAALALAALPQVVAAEVVTCHFTEEAMGDGTFRQADLWLSYIMPGDGALTVRVEATGAEVSGLVRDLARGQRTTDARDADAGIDVMGNLNPDGTANVMLVTPQTGFGVFRGDCTGMPTG